MLLWWLVKNASNQCHPHRMVKLVLLAMPRRHKPPPEADPEPKEMLQNSLALWGGSDLARYLQEKEGC